MSSAFDALTAILAAGVNTRQQVDKKLAAKGFSVQERQSALDKAEDYGYLNDAEYARIYVAKYGKMYGINKIKAGLMQRGVNKDIIEEALEEVTDNFESALSFAQKFAASSDISDKKNQTKLYRKLCYRGYTNAICMRVLEELISNVR